MIQMGKFSDMLAKLGKFSREKFAKLRDTVEEERPPKDPYYTTDRFWLTRWIRDIKYKRVGLTTITYLGPEYDYRMDYDRIPKSQLDMMRRSQPCPVHRSGRGWNEWVLFKDDSVTPFPVVMPEGTDFVNSFCNPTAIDLHLYMVDNHIDQALSFSKKTEIPIDGKMLAVVGVIVVVMVFFLLGMFS